MYKNTLEMTFQANGNHPIQSLGGEYMSFSFFVTINRATLNLPVCQVPYTVAFVSREHFPRSEFGGLKPFVTLVRVCQIAFQKDSLPYHQK